MNHLPLPRHRATASGEGSSRSSARPEKHTTLAEQYDRDKQRIISCCFSKVEQGVPLESYITHCRITEYSGFPSSRPPPSVPESAKKPRVIIISVRKSGRVRMHKARENPNGTFQIGKTWNLDELTKLENDLGTEGGFTIYLGKAYYWTTHSSRERVVFINSIVRIYKKYTGYVPELVGLDDIVDDAIRQGPVKPASLSSSPAAQAQGGPQRGSQSVHSGPGPASGSPVLSGLSSPSTGAPRSNILQPPRGPPTPSSVRLGMTSTHSGHSLPGNGAPVTAATAIASTSRPATEKPSRPTIDTEVPRVEQPRLSARSVRSNNSFERPPLSATSVEQYIPGEFNVVKARKKSIVQETSSAPPSNGSTASSTVTDQRTISSYGTAGGTIGTAVSSIAAVSGVPPASPADPISDEPVQPQVEGLAIQISDDTAVGSTQEKSMTPSQRVGHKRERSAVQEINIVAHSPHRPEDQNKSPNESSPGDSTGDSSIVKSGDITQDIIDQEGQDTMTQLKTDKHQQATSSEHSRASWSRRRLSFSAMSNISAVEETLGEFNWCGRDDALTLENGINKELAEIEASNLHDVVDLDSRLDELDQSLEIAITECERLDAMFAFFSMQLGSFSDDISHIESQGQGLQVQTTNQKILWNELHDLLQTASMRTDSMELIRSSRFDNLGELTQTEKSLIELYTAVKAVRPSDSDDSNASMGIMKALKEKKHVHEQLAVEFMAHFREFLENKFKDAMGNAESALPDVQINEDPKLQRIDAEMLQDLYPYSGILLFTKEIDNVVFNSILKNYEMTVRPYFENAVPGYLAKWRRIVGALTGNNGLVSFAGREQPAMNESIVSKSLKRSGTLAKFRDNTVRSDKSSATSPNLPTQDDAPILLDRDKRLQIQRSLRKLLEGLTSNVVAQQEALILLFHQASFGEFPVFVERFPARSRAKEASYFDSPHIREIDNDRVRSQDVVNAMGTIFDSLQEQLGTFAEFLATASIVSCPSFIVLIELCLKKLEATNQDFLSSLLQRIRDKIIILWNNFITEQISNVNNTIISSKKRRGAVHFVRVFPVFCQAVEEDLKEVYTSEGDAVNELRCRRLMDESYDNVSRAMFHNLQRIANEHDNSVQSSAVSSTGGNNDYEDKEQLNYHVMMIENMKVLTDGLEELENFTLSRIRQRAMEIYRKELELYNKTVMHRPLGKLMDFVDGLETIVEKNPSEKPNQRHGYNKASLKKAMASYDAKEVRKGIENLRRRVEKHFNDEEREETNSHLVEKVWNSLQAEYTSYYTRLVKFVAQYYLEPGMDITSFVEFSKTDILSAFARK